MNTRKLLLASLLALALSAWAQTDEPKTAYLFTYFTGNQPAQEQICYALSDDGFHFTPLNGGQPVIHSDTIALTGGVRDPHILRAEDGHTFLQVATDMHCSQGWDSNRGLVLMKSADLIHWTHATVHFPTTYPRLWANTIHVWAPQTIYDREAGKYMVYYALATRDSRGYDRIYYSYANADFTALEGTPTLLYESKNGKPVIDADIVFNPSDRLYHFFMKTEGEHGPGIYHATSPTLTPAQGQRAGEQWTLLDGKAEQTKQQVEGSGVCPTLDGKGWILMYDCYQNGHYQFCSSPDLTTFTAVADTETKGVFTPRHGTLLPITEAEKQRLLLEWGNHGNPILPGFHADPEILYSNKTKRYYIYSTTDGLPGWGGWTFSVFSSQNLKDWTDEGVVLDVKSGQVGWAKGNAWAPAAIEVKQPDGSYKYYLYFSADAGKRKEIGVAVSDSPTGPFVDSGAPIVSDSPVGHGQQIDVDVFFDPKSKKHYLYWGNGYMAGAELNADLLSIKQETVTVMTPQGGTLQTYAFREAPYVFLRKGKYYFMWSVDDTGSPNYHVSYGTSSSPLGPIEVAAEPNILWQRPEQRLYGTAHNSVLQLPGKDEWYIVYHRINKHYIDRSQSPGTHREVCIDRMTFDKQGRILPVTPTLDGPAPLKTKK